MPFPQMKLIRGKRKEGGGRWLNPTWTVPNQLIAGLLVYSVLRTGAAEDFAQPEPSLVWDGIPAPT